MRAIPFVVVTLALLAAVGCPKGDAAAELPPPGLAGQPGQPGGLSPQALALPGTGPAVGAPTGTDSPATQLPAGHPPVAGADGAAGGAAGAAPSNHPPMGNGPGAPGMGAGGAAVVLSGSVQEILEVPEYTYMRVKTSMGEDWVAVNKTKVAVGDVVTVEESLVMENFPSRALNRTFPKLVMGVLIGAPKKP